MELLIIKSKYLSEGSDKYLVLTVSDTKNVRELRFLVKSEDGVCTSPETKNIFNLCGVSINSKKVLTDFLGKRVSVEFLPGGGFIYKKSLLDEDKEISEFLREVRKSSDRAKDCFEAVVFSDHPISITEYYSLMGDK